MKKEENFENIVCPICGYYCVGKGGIGCIDKPFILYKRQKQLNKDMMKILNDNKWELYER